MSELKTLKDIEPVEESFIYRNDLKQEAIKWVKYYQDYDSPWNQGMVYILKKIFNLIEEDIK